MLVLNGYNVKISRGDSYAITVAIDGFVEPGSIARAAIAKRAGAEPIWQKTVTIADNMAIFELTAAETGLAADKYVWDVRVIFPDGSVKTVFTPATFQIVEVVGRG